MDNTLVARFNNLSQAESAAAKLQSLRAREVNITRLAGQGGPEDRDDTDMTMYQTPAMGVGMIGFGSMPYAIDFMTGGYIAGQSSGTEPAGNATRSGYQLDAVVTADTLDQAKAVIKEAGGVWT